MDLQNGQISNNNYSENNVWKINTRLNWAEDVDQAEAQGELRVLAEPARKNDEDLFPSLEVSRGLSLSGKKAGRRSKAKPSSVSLQQFNVQNEGRNSNPQVLRMMLPQHSRQQNGDTFSGRGFGDSYSQYRKDYDDIGRESGHAFGRTYNSDSDQFDRRNRSGMKGGQNFGQSYDRQYRSSYGFQQYSENRGNSQFDDVPRGPGFGFTPSQADMDDHWQDHSFRREAVNYEGGSQVQFGKNRRSDQSCSFGERRRSYRDTGFAHSSNAVDFDRHTQKLQHRQYFNNHNNNLQCEEVVYERPPPPSSQSSYTPSTTPNNASCNNLPPTPQSVDVEVISDPVQNLTQQCKKCDPFAGAKPREEVLKRRKEETHVREEISGNEHHHHVQKTNHFDPNFEVQQEFSNIEVKCQTAEAVLGSCREITQNSSLSQSPDHLYSQNNTYNQEFFDKIKPGNSFQSEEKCVPAKKVSKDPFAGALPREEVLKRRENQPQIVDPRNRQHTDQKLEVRQEEKLSYQQENSSLYSNRQLENSNLVQDIYFEKEESQQINNLSCQNLNSSQYSNRQLKDSQLVQDIYFEKEESQHINNSSCQNLNSVPKQQQNFCDKPPIIQPVKQRVQKEDPFGGARPREEVLKSRQNFDQNSRLDGNQEMRSSRFSGASFVKGTIRSQLLA